MSRKLFIPVSVLALAGSAVAAHASVLWKGDFQTGDLSQWTGEEWTSSDRLQVVTTPTVDGRPYALRALVQPGDDPTHSVGGNRNEVFYQGDRPQDGDDRYYRWQTMWPSDYASEPYWQVFTQWHQYVSGGSPPLAFQAVGDQIMLGDPTDHYYWTAPLVRGVWHDFVFHVKWSTSGSVGGVELWYDGQHVLPFTHGITLFPHDTVYVKQGLYRKDVIDKDQTVYHDGMTIGTTLADVMPPAPAPQSASAPTSLGSPSSLPSSPTLTASESGQVTSFAKAQGCTSTGLAVGAPAFLFAGLMICRRRRRLSNR